MRILISTPCYQNGVNSQMAQSLLRAIEGARSSNHSVNWDTPSSSLLSFNRNQSAYNALKDQYDWLLFWDSDIEVDQDNFIGGLINTAYMNDASIVGIPCPLKTFPTIYNFANKTTGKYVNETVLPGIPVAVDAVGTGVMLVKTSILARIPTPWFTITDTYHDKPGFFPEDWNFCEKVKEKGGLVFIDPRFTCYHWGNQRFGTN